MKNRMSYASQQKLVVFTFLLFPVILLLVFGFLPILNMFFYSFLQWDGIGEKTFIGIKNYIELFSRQENLRVFGVSIYYFVGSLVQLALALLFAVILSSKMRAQNFFKGVLFFPNLVNGVAIGFIFLYFFKDTGTLNEVLKVFGLEGKVLWLTDPGMVNYSLTFTSIWRYMGFNVVMFVAAIQSLPSDMYEAANLDGASAWQQFWYLTFPGIAPMIQINMILAVKGAVSVFEIPYIMTGGGNGSSTFVIRTMDTAFKFNKIGLASAMAIVLTVIVLVVSAIQNRMFRNSEGGIS
ncbi:carbohydrate ABC transporter permease [Treponema saccharophilum]|uniref:Carbohydrate ABC transporter membrane protein 1, CUT1 family n=1 Tax=Treponema saccharophilum DSM 2985 TaxID=907348 RepID=H7EHR4_9SPIR|nr:sugar ABC transporter permease [Treponema saccharophilum]EIC02854.1 carbohydrate ABC transporter membrane protein 1, CUT1 family [Treponema saccharophilum DSM 2985]BDC97372.1 ABC transporter permease [Treponema saccharophilum]